MKKIIFKGRQYSVLAETATYYVCSPENQNEGYHFISKDKAEEVNECLD